MNVTPSDWLCGSRDPGTSAVGHPGEGPAQLAWMLGCCPAQRPRHLSRARSARAWSRLPGGQGCRAAAGGGAGPRLLLGPFSTITPRECVCVCACACVYARVCDRQGLRGRPGLGVEGGRVPAFCGCEEVAGDKQYFPGSSAVSNVLQVGD